MRNTRNRGRMWHLLVLLVVLVSVVVVPISLGWSGYIDDGDSTGDICEDLARQELALRANIAQLQDYLSEVELLREIECAEYSRSDVVFNDGFESGDLSSWH